MKKPTAVRERWNFPPLEPTPNLPAVQTEEPTPLRRSLPAPVERGVQAHIVTPDPLVMTRRAEALILILPRLEEVLLKWEAELAKMKLRSSVEVFDNAERLRRCREERAKSCYKHTRDTVKRVAMDEASGEPEQAKYYLKILVDYVERRRKRAIEYLTESIYDRAEEPSQRLVLVASMTKDINRVYGGGLHIHG